MEKSKVEPARYFHECLQCGWRWVGMPGNNGKNKPRRCPYCNTERWNILGKADTGRPRARPKQHNFRLYAYKEERKVKKNG